MSEPVTRERVEGAIAWYRKHRVEIIAALPVATPGVTFLAGWPESLEQYIEKWQKANYPLRLAVSYIHHPITLVALAMKQAATKKEL